MTVGELIGQLLKLDPDLYVVIASRDHYGWDEVEGAHIIEAADTDGNDGLVVVISRFNFSRH